MVHWSLTVKLLIFALLVFIPFGVQASEPERPFIWVKDSDRASILQKIENTEWAGELFQTLKTRADEATAGSLSERREKLLTLPLIWPESPNQAPTLKRYSKKDKQHGEARRWGYPRAIQESMLNGLQNGVDCSVLYYLTEEVKYAHCAADMLTTFINALLNIPIDTEASRKDLPLNGGWIYEDNHLLEARIVGAQIPIIYDLVHPYLESGGTVYDLASGKLVPFDFAAAQKVFETYIKLALTKGLYDSNWPVLESSSLLHNILALDDEQKIAEKLPYYLERDTQHQASLETVAKMYPAPGDIWPESLGYSRHVTFLCVYLMTALDRIYPELDLGKRYPNIAESMTAFYNLQFPNDEYPFFGDGHRHYEVEYSYYEMALQLARMNGIESQEKMFSDFLTSSIANGKYDRGELETRHYSPSPYHSPLQLLWSKEDLAGDEDIDLEPPRPRTNRVPHAGMTIQRIISDEQPVKNSLMAFTAGASYIHGHASGMDMELYGQGYVLGIDGGKGTYSTSIHENYYRLFAAHNAVISNGASAAQGEWVNLGMDRVTPSTMEPALGKNGVSPRHSFVTSVFADKYNNVAPADHQRTLALVKLSDSQGYYLDVYRARSDTPDQYHDYLYHNIGDSLKITRNGSQLPLQEDPGRYQASAGAPWLSNQVFQHPGWHFFEDVKSSASSMGPYEATFTASRLADTPIVMRALVPAGLESEITEMNAPQAYGAAEPYNKAPLPSFALRHEGEAWQNPFVVVYESNSGQPAVESVVRLMDGGVFKGVKVTSTVAGESLVQFILVQENPDDHYIDEASGIRFTGRFAVLTLKANGELIEAYIGNGQRLSYKEFVINADENSHAAYLRE